MTADKITLTFDDSPKMRAVLRHLAEYASMSAKTACVEGREGSYEAFDVAVERAIDDDEPGALVTPIDPMTAAVNSYVWAIVEATVAFDKESESGMIDVPSVEMRRHIVEALPRDSRREIAKRMADRVLRGVR
jgi:hypothetical protein